MERWDSSDVRWNTVPRTMAATGNAVADSV